MKKPNLISSGALGRLHKASKEAWKRKDFQQFFEVVERASRLDPANASILIDLGRAYGLRHDYAAAERCFEKALRVAPDKTGMLTVVARECAEFASDDLAERYFRRAVEPNTASADTIARFAELCERRNRLPEAAELVDRALRVDAASGRGMLMRARLERRKNRLEDAEKVLRAWLPGAKGDCRVLGWYELGKVLDRQGRCDEAMAAFLEAKALLLPDAAALLAQRQASVGALQQRLDGLSAEMVRRWFDDAPELGPPRRLALLGGHPRSGTTLLEQVLDSHPDIISAEETEIIFDDACPPLERGFPENAPMISVLDGASNGLVQESREKYFSAMEQFLGESPGDRLLIDKNPPKFHGLPAYLRIFPEIKILVALRDPRDVCLSCFMQSYVPVTRGGLSYLSLETTVEACVLLLGMWRTIAPLLPNPYLEVKYRDTVADLESVSRRVLEFLGVPWDSRVLRFDEHARQKRVRSPTYADVTKPIFSTSVGRWRNYQKYFEPHLKKLEPFVKAFGFE